MNNDAVAKPIRFGTARFFTVSLAIAWTAVALASWSAFLGDGSETEFLGVPIAFLSVFLVAFSIVWMRLARIAGVRMAAVLAGVAAVGGWFVLLLPPFYFLIGVGFAAMGETGAGLQGAVRDFRIAVCVCVSLGVANNWCCSRAAARRMARALSLPLTLLVTATSLTVSAGLTFGAVALRRADNAAEERRAQKERDTAEEGQRVKEERRTQEEWNRAAEAGQGCERAAPESGAEGRDMRRETCFELGERTLKGNGVTKDARRAAEIYKWGCKRVQEPSSCEGLGLLYETGEGVVLDLGEAVGLYEDACALATGAARRPSHACARLALMYEEGRGVPKDLQRALFILWDACGRQDAHACIQLGLMYEDGRSGVTDETRAAALFREACDLKNEEGCADLLRATRH